MFNSYENNSDTVLIVEDTSENHEIIETFLKDINVRCEHAYTGAEAVEMCRSSSADHYSLILMDVNLPQMDGIEAASRIRELGINTPVIAVTASSKNELSHEESGDFCFMLYKPFTYSDFYTAISPYIKNAAMFPLSIDENRKGDNVMSAVENHICDIPKAISNMGNSERLFVKHLRNFISNNADLYARLQELVDHENYIDAASLCHSIKGLAGMLALTDLYHHIIELETLLKYSDVIGSLDLNNVNESLRDIKLDIQSVCKIHI